MRKATALSVAVVLVGIAIGAIGCGTEEGVRDLVLEEFGLTWINEEAQGAYYLDISVIDSDEVLTEAFEYLLADDEELQGLGIERSQIDYVVSPVGADIGPAGIALGRFDFDHVREELGGSGLTRSTYLDTEFWEGDLWPYADAGVALFSNGLVWGDVDEVRSLVRTIQGAEPSIWEAANVSELHDRLPAWTPFMAIVALDPMPMFGIPNAEAAVLVVARESADEFRFAWAVEFRQPIAAAEWYDVVAGQENVQATIEMGYVAYEARMTLEEFLAQL